MGYSLGEYFLVIASQPFIKLFDSIEIRKKKQAEKIRLLESLKPAVKKEMERGLTHLAVTKTSYVFKKINDPMASKIEFKGYEYTKFDPDKDQIFHGVLKINKLDENGKKIEEVVRDIYTYQPRFDGTNNINIGPIYYDDGSLASDKAYRLFSRSEKNILAYETNIPKREIVSDDVFDFDSSYLANKKASSMKIFGKDNVSGINIVYDTNADGRLKPVDLTNKNDLSKLNNYLKEYRKNNINTNLNDWEAFANQCRYELGNKKEAPTTLYNDISASNKLVEYINQINKNEEIIDENNKKFQEEMARDRARERRAIEEEMKAQEEKEEKEALVKKTQELDYKNAKFINDYLYYDSTPTVSSPLSRGGMPPVGGPGMHGGPMGGPMGNPMPGGPNPGEPMEGPARHR